MATSDKMWFLYSYSDNSVGTTSLSAVLGVLSLKNHEQSTMVSEGGLEPP